MHDQHIHATSVAQAPRGAAPPPPPPPPHNAALEALVEAATEHVGPLPIIWADDDEHEFTNWDAYPDAMNFRLSTAEQAMADWTRDASDEELTQMAAAATASTRAILARRGIPIIDEYKAIFDPEPPTAAAKDVAMKTERSENLVAFDAARDTQPLPSLRSMFDITQNADAELSWQVDGMTPHGAVMLFAGGKSSGKSTLSRMYALAVARGEPFLGREVEQGPVVVASLEDPKGVSSEHWRQLGLRGDDPVHGWDGALPDDPASWLHRAAPRPPGGRPRLGAH